MKHAILEKLRDILGSERLTDAREDLLCYSYDATSMEYLPEAVAFPESTEEVSRIMTLASLENFPVTPRGAGTGMTGGALPVRGGLLLVLSRMNRILEIDSANQLAVVEPGVITGRLKEEVRRFGLYYPPDPASYNFCTIGGNVANSAGGPSAVKYGVTRDYVLGLEVVLPSGKILHTGVRTAKGVVGYDLTRLMVGSEGTLGIITSIILRLVSCPVAKTTFLLISPGVKEATGLVARILSSWLPCTLEYMDRTALQIVAPSLPFSIPDAGGAMLLIEFDGDTVMLAEQSRRFVDFLNLQEGLLLVKQAASPEEVESLWKARRSISPAAFQLKPHKISEDIVVPRSRIPELVGLVQELNAAMDPVAFTFGHAGDGNIHMNIMLDKDNPAEVREANAAKEKIFAMVIALQGTLSGEHGVGLTKANYLKMEIDDDTLEMMRRLKSLFDPQNILNPGKIFPS